MKRRKIELQLFPDVATGQRRYTSPEARDIYDAVSKLRQFGERVWRAGKFHLVNGKQLTDDQLKQRAASVRFR